jgi:hypothetical protein
MGCAPTPLDRRLEPCDHNCIPCRGGLRHFFRAGWVCVRCGEWGRTPLPRPLSTYRPHFRMSSAETAVPFGGTAATPRKLVGSDREENR